MHKIALYIAMNKDFNKFQKNNFETSLGFIGSYGSQPTKIDISGLDNQSTDKLIEKTLKIKNK